MRTVEGRQLEYIFCSKPKACPKMPLVQTKSNMALCLSSIGLGGNAVPITFPNVLCKTETYLELGPMDHRLEFLATACGDYILYEILHKQERRRLLTA